MAIIKKTASIDKTYIELVRGNKLRELGPNILQIETDKQYINGAHGVYICELTEEGHKLNKW